MIDNLFEGAKVLDVGSGSGYLSACFARLVGRAGKVIAVEHIPELCKLGKENVKRDDSDLLQTIEFVGIQC